MKQKMFYFLLLAGVILHSEEWSSTTNLRRGSLSVEPRSCQTEINFIDDYLYALNTSDGQHGKSNSKTDEIFKKLINETKAGNWKALPIGELIGKLALQLIGTKYEANTLEGMGPEICRIKLEGLDCVTLFENVLCLARNVKKNKMTLGELYDEVTYTRYRSGVLDGYASRLHYTSDWIYDNIKKGVVADITQNIGGEELKINVFFMSRNPDYYLQLKNNPDLIDKIAEIEQNINQRKYYCIPKSKLASIEKQLQTGDIIAIATNKQGLDYSHTGIIIKDKTGAARFLHASSKKNAVVLDEALSKYLRSKDSDIGITVLRPIEVE